MTTMVGTGLTGWQRVIAARDRLMSTRGWLRTTAGVVLAVLLGIVLAGLVSPMVASAAGDDKKESDYSLYTLGSNAAGYFAKQMSPETGGDVPNEWKDIWDSPAEAGGMLGYADGDWVKWLLTPISAASQTIKYDALDTSKSSGMYEYALFGATNNALGLDSMFTNAGFDGIIHAVGGFIVFVLYILNMFVAILFWFVIKLLKMLNPYMWFHDALTSMGTPFASNMAELMVRDGDLTLVQGGGALSGLASWISSWYSVLLDLSWQVLVPLMLGFLLIGLVMFRKLDRGAAIKRFIVRVLFIALGLPLVGGIYTSVLDQFDTTATSSASAPTKMVLSTYVDVDAWVNNTRLAVPEEAVIEWDEGADAPSSRAISNVRTTALAINAHSNPDFSPFLISLIPVSGNVTEITPGNTPSGVMATVNLLTRYMSSQTLTAAEYESNVQKRITLSAISNPKDLFTSDKYKSAQNFGTGARPGPNPTDHPLFSTGGAGLTTDKEDGVYAFTTEDVGGSCGLERNSSLVDADGAPVPCNLSPMATYNYLGTHFGPTIMTIYSSNNTSSSFTQEFHTAVSQVGNGPVGFMYWASLVILLLCAAILGFAYALGLLKGSLKRAISSIGAVLPAAVGSMSAIAKVIIYALVLIIELIVTVFLYQFAGEITMSLPRIIETPITSWVLAAGASSIFPGSSSVIMSSPIGVVVMIIVAVITCTIVIAVTIVLMKTRKGLMTAIDEAVTKVIDKFLLTSTPSVPSGPKGGMRAALGDGLGRGVGQALGNRAMGGNPMGGSKSMFGSGKGPQLGQPGPTPGGSQGGPALPGGPQQPQQALPTGSSHPRPSNAAGTGPAPLRSAGTPMLGLPAPQGAAGQPDPSGSGSDSGGADSQDGSSTTSQIADSQSDRALAARVNDQGGLTPLGFGPQTQPQLEAGKPVSPGGSKPSSPSSTPGDGAQGGTAGGPTFVTAPDGSEAIRLSESPVSSAGVPTSTAGSQGGVAGTSGSAPSVGGNAGTPSDLSITGTPTPEAPTASSAPGAVGSGTRPKKQLGGGSGQPPVSSTGTSGSGKPQGAPRPQQPTTPPRQNPNPGQSGSGVANTQPPRKPSTQPQSGAKENSRPRPSSGNSAVPPVTSTPNRGASENSAPRTPRPASTPSSARRGSESRPSAQIPLTSSQPSQPSSGPSVRPSRPTQPSAQTPAQTPSQAQAPQAPRAPRVMPQAARQAATPNPVSPPVPRPSAPAPSPAPPQGPRQDASNEPTKPTTRRERSGRGRRKD